MDKKLTIPSNFKLITLILIGIGVLAIIFGFIKEPDRAWANLLLNNYYFLTVAIGASFFAAIQSVTQSGWSSGFIRIPHGIANYIPVAAILMIPLFFGMHYLYEWSEKDALLDPVIAHKSPFLNIPFFIIRFFLYFTIWIFLTQLLRRFSLKEDQYGGLKWFHKTEFYSKVYIFALAVTFSLSTFDWIMSIDVHWFSTIFAIKNFVMSFYQGSVFITFIIIILNKLGYLPFFNKYHLRDLTKYIYMLCIIWIYLWFAQYILIWYANIPEETVYYLPRTKGEFKPFFYAEMIVNWLIPFLMLMPKQISTNKNAVLVVCCILIIGHWIDSYQQIFPGVVHHFRIGFPEIGSFLGFLGLFAIVVAYALSRVPLVPKNHPFIEECLNHHR
jgi:hypothetical protein